MMAMNGSPESLARLLDGHAREGSLWQAEDGGAVRCTACGHRCLVKPGLRGICKVRFNRDGRLFAPHGYVSSLACDPTEKKPFFHVLPGSSAMTFGMLGCDFHCPFCQNWVTSQTLRDPAAVWEPWPVGARDIVDAAVRAGAELIASSYNEPLITAEWAVEVFRLARSRGLRTLFVSNGNATDEALRYLRPWLDGFNIDLKSMSDRSYRRLGGTLDRVLETIGRAHEMGFWVEVVTLVVPGFNDSDGELREAARFLASVSPDIPWHVTAFRGEYRMRESDNTTAEGLQRAARIGEEEGLRFVYAGNLPGRAGRYEDTRCHGCGRVVVRRRGYSVSSYDVTSEGACPDCGRRIPGIWWREEGAGTRAE